MYEYLADKNFLYQLDKIKIKITYIRLSILDFVTESPLREIQGIAQSGSINVNGNSAVRRTINLTLVADESMNDITNVKNLISLKTKVKVLIGIKNPLKSYAQYGDIIWFPQGVFVCTNIQFNRSSNGMNISFQGQDKMILLNGTLGGVIPASTTFTEIYTYDKDKNVTITNPSMRQIIQEAVEHIGCQPADKIIISDLSETVKKLMRYNGASPIWFNSNHSSFIISDSRPAGFPEKYSYHQDVGYMMTDFTYPGELILNAGETVVSLLEKIKGVLGNYEYFFDLEGNFVFQEIKNYLNNSYTPIITSEQTTTIKDYLDREYNRSKCLVSLPEGTYAKVFSDTKYAYSLTDDSTVVSYQRSPKISDIKNDFIVWGTRKTVEGAESGIRYHLAVDVKPQIDLAGKYMWKITETDEELGELILKYEYTDYETQKPRGGTLIGIPCTEWREELYRQALERSLSGTARLYYDEELLAEWREKLFDPLNEDWKKEWRAVFPSEPWEGWNPRVYTDPASLDYWLDFIDSTDALTQFSVNVIGRRTKVVNDKDVKSIYNKKVPDILFIENNGSAESEALSDQSIQIGQDYCFVKPDQMSYFSTSTTPKSAYDEIRALVYQHLTYNSSISITCQPKYYLSPNNLIYIEDKRSGISGNFIITQFTLPLTYNGTMSIVATEALTRV